jgi:3-phenylpropionate/trans-cinnamate dioxygenase ferredoxin reductase subunit
MTGQPEHVLVIGAGLGGVRTAEQLRAAGYQGRISLVGAEPHIPYDRPPLSKQILTGEWAPARAVLRTLDQLEDLGVRAHLGQAAVALRPGEVELSDGSTLHGDAVVVATGLVARRLPGQPAQVHTLRTLSDALALRERLEGIGSLLIIGAGFIGAEVATAARARGIEVTVLEGLAAPAARALGPAVGELVSRLYAEAGVRLHTGVSVVRLTADAARARAELSDGRVFEADAGLVGIGGTAQLSWLDAHLDPASELRCDSRGRVRGRPGIWAVGDVAVWERPGSSVPRREEHWTSAGDQAAVVARDILGAPVPPPTVPYFWSDQFGLKIQLLGRPEQADEVIALHGDGLAGGAVPGTVIGYLAGGMLVAVVGFGAARLIVRYRPLVAGAAGRVQVRALAGEL